MGPMGTMLRAALRTACLVSRPAVLSVLAPALFLVCTTESRADDGICASAHVDEAFVLPDGSEHPSGRLTLCLSRDLTPVASLHRTFVDGMPIGAFTSRRTAIEGEDGQYFLFDRAAAGTLSLAGYSCPYRGGSGTFLLDRSGEVRVRQGTRASASKPLDRDGAVRIAAAGT